MNGEVTTRDAQWVTVIEDMKTGDIHEDSNILIYLRTLLHLCLRLDATIPPRFCFETSDSVDYLVGYETLLRLCMIIGLAKGLLDWEYNTLWKRLCWLNLRCKTTRMTTPRTTMSHGKKRTDIADLSSLLNKSQHHPQISTSIPNQNKLHSPHIPVDMSTPPFSIHDRPLGRLYSAQLHTRSHIPTLGRLVRALVFSAQALEAL